jgi:hypothetical protein
MHNFARPTFYMMIEHELLRIREEIKKKIWTEKDAKELNHLISGDSFTWRDLSN